LENPIGEYKYANRKGDHISGPKKNIIITVRFYGTDIKKFLVGYLVKDRLGVIAQGGFLFSRFPKYSKRLVPNTIGNVNRFFLIK
tara:strand:- start:34716 stop:34970 length:255 start_codon:yes stop_codon:yes gene_type:complete